MLTESKWTAEFFSTIGTLILNVHLSKSGLQLKSSTIFITVSTFDFLKTLNLLLIQILFASFYSFCSFQGGVVSSQIFSQTEVFSIVHNYAIQFGWLNNYSAYTFTAFLGCVYKGAFLNS